MPSRLEINTVFVAIADPTRRAVLDELRAGDRSAGELHEAVGRGISQPAFSQKLAQLRESGLVEARREGRRRVYRVMPEALHVIAAWAAGFDRAWDVSLDRLGSYLDRKNAFRAKGPSKKGRERTA